MSSAAARQLAELAETIISQMKEGAETWYMPWHKGLQEPVNALAGRVFQERNAAILWNASTLRNYQKNAYTKAHHQTCSGFLDQAAEQAMREQ